MEEAVDSVASKALGKGLEICAYMNPATKTHVIGDPDRLRQIFLNLLSNGIKFTNLGQVCMCVCVCVCVYMCVCESVCMYVCIYVCERVASKTHVIGDPDRH